MQQYHVFSYSIYCTCVHNHTYFLHHERWLKNCPKELLYLLITVSSKVGQYYDDIIYHDINILKKHPGCKKVQGQAEVALWVSVNVTKIFDIN